jgi:type I restriction enzyme, S subunit
MSNLKETECGRIPVEWDLKTIDEVKLKEKKSIISGPFGSNISSKFFVPVGVPVIRGNNLSLDVGKRFIDDGFVFITEEKAKELDTWAIKDDLIFTAAGTLGQVGILTGSELYPQYVISNKQLRVRLDPTVVVPLFAYYWFASPLMIGAITQRDTGSTIPLINLSVLKGLPIPVPSLREQEAISELLISLDEKIDLLRRQNQTLEALAEALFRRWFIEEADETWEVGRLGDVISIYDSQRIPLSSMERAKMKSGKLYPYYGAATVMDYINKYIFDGEYILMAEDGTVQTDGGYPILQMPTGKFWVNNHTHIFQAKSPYSNYFIYTFLRRTNITNTVTGAVQPKINQENLKSIAFVIPPDEKTNAFVSVTNEFWSKVRSNNNQIHTLQQQRDTLLPKLMNGVVRVTPLRNG